MKRSIRLHIASLPFLFAAVPLFSQNMYHRTTIQASAAPTYSTPWVDSGSHAGSAWSSTTAYVEIFPDSQYQTVKGFGGTFQEKGWDAINYMTAAGRDSVIRAIFDTSGLNLCWGRVPIGCCDFDNNRAPYSLNDSAGDFQMRYFSLARDSLNRIPYIRLAQAYQPNMRFWASPWSPPRWMKSNNQYYQGSMKSDSATLTAYALYLEKFVQGYKAKGINIEMVTCQNEPDQNTQAYPTCGWADTLQKTFYKKHLIPLFKRDSISARLILGVYCCGSYNMWIRSFMQDSVIRNFVSATSHSYQSPGWGDSSWREQPSVPFFETESAYGSNSQTWATGVTQFRDMANFMNNKTTLFTIWNIINNQKCQSGWNWGQYVMIIIDTTNGRPTYTPYYWAAKHFSYYVKTGARGIKMATTGITNLTSSAFRNPNGDIILVTGSANTSATPITVKVGSQMFKTTLPANSFNTLRITNATAVREYQLLTKGPDALGKAFIRNSTLHFTVPLSMDAREMDVSLTDLQGRTLWSGSIGDAALRHERQAIAVRPAGGIITPGTCIMTVKIRNAASAVMTASRKVAVVN